jgi:hypothetical protein
MAKSNGHAELVGTSEAAAILRVEKPRVGRYVRTGLMPEPVAVLHATKVWRREDVLALKEALDARENEHTRPRFRVAPSRKMNLVGTSEAAEILGVERTRIGRWLKADPPRMIDPLVRLSATPVWLRKDVERFAAKLAKQRSERVAA